MGLAVQSDSARGNTQETQSVTRVVKMRFSLTSIPELMSAPHAMSIWPMWCWWRWATNPMLDAADFSNRHAHNMSHTRARLRTHKHVLVNM